jgi:hypothetical protein
MQRQTTARRPVDAHGRSVTHQRLDAAVSAAIRGSTCLLTRPASATFVRVGHQEGWVLGLMAEATGERNAGVRLSGRRQCMSRLGSGLVQGVPSVMEHTR